MWTICLKYNLNGTVRDPRRILNSAAGELKSRNPKWVVDIDDVSMMNANTNEYVDDITDNAECWCEDCDKHTKLKEV